MIKDFEYFAPRTVKEACQLLSKLEDAKVIAGGQSLLVLLKQRLVTPKSLVDVKNIPRLNYIKFDQAQGLRIGATATHRAIELSPLIKRKFPALAEMEQTLASIQTRNWGTIGGNLCHADPAGDPAPPLLVLNAAVKLASATGERSIPMEEFFKDFYETALQPGEILAEIQVPTPPPYSGAAYKKFSLSEGDMPIVGVAVFFALDAARKTCKEARIALGAVAPTAMRARKAEKVLAGKEISDALIEKAAQVASQEASPISDIHASEDYRRELVKVMLGRTAKEALVRAQKA